jgi:protein-S-isoprenylcysteine O-methyltransferase Ste14
MLWLRGLIFSLVVPGVVGVIIPARMHGNSWPTGGWPMAGWLLLTAGAAIYGLCLFLFLISGGTPAIFFMRHFRSVVGEEPRRVEQEGIYRVSRNPMYAGVVLAVFGRAALFASFRIATYGFGLWLLFHLVVVFLEEPHLRRVRGPTYEDYCRKVPRWF